MLECCATGKLIHWRNCRACICKIKFTQQFIHIGFMPVLYVVVIIWCWVQYGKYFLSEILHKATGNNYFIIKCLFKSNDNLIVLRVAWYNLMLCGTNKQKQKLQVLTLSSYVLYFLKALYFHISIRIFCNMFICLVFGSLLQLICFWMFCSKHSVTFDTYLLSCWFHCVDIFYIKFRSCETFTVTNSEAMLLLIETLSNWRTIKCWFILYLHIYVLG